MLVPGCETYNWCSAKMYTNLGQLVMKGHCSPEVSNTLPPQPGFHAGENVIGTIAFFSGVISTCLGDSMGHTSGVLKILPRRRTTFFLHFSRRQSRRQRRCRTPGFLVATFGGARRNAVEGVIPTQYGCDYWWWWRRRQNLASAKKFIQIANNRYK